MVTDLKPIRTEADYEDALAEVERLWGVKSGTPEGDRLDVLATLIDVYEAKHYPMDPPDPVPHGTAGAQPQGSGANDWTTQPCGRRLESQAQPVDRDDPAVA